MKAEIRLCEIKNRSDNSKEYTLFVKTEKGLIGFNHIPIKKKDIETLHKTLGLEYPSDNKNRGLKE